MNSNGISLRSDNSDVECLDCRWLGKQRELSSRLFPLYNLVEGDIVEDECPELCCPKCKSLNIEWKY